MLPIPLHFTPLTSENVGLLYWPRYVIRERRPNTLTGFHVLLEKSFALHGDDMLLDKIDGSLACGVSRDELATLLGQLDEGTDGLLNELILEGMVS